MDRIVEIEPSTTRGVDTENPWPGLVAFTEDLQEFFHGRPEEIADLLRRVRRKNLTVLFGQSGLGKSSLLNAGLFPQLRAEGFLPVSIRLDHASMALSLAAQVKTAVKRAVANQASWSGGGEESREKDEGSETLWEFLHRRQSPLETPSGNPVRLVLVFDQFEEFFSLGQSTEAGRGRTRQFLVELADLIENRAPASLERRLEERPQLAKQFAFEDQEERVLISLREDYLPHLEGLRSSIPSLMENRVRLTRLNGCHALEAVVNPGRHLITAEVGRQVIRFVAGAKPREDDSDVSEDELAGLEIEPSLLNLVCRELNNRRLSEALPEITSDLLAGSRERILQDFYERCMADQPVAVRAFVEDELVTDSGLRENVALERATKALAHCGASASAIDTLVRRRLLHLEERLDIQRVELTHDVLTPVVKKSRDERQQKEAVARAEEQAREVRAEARLQRRRLQAIVAGMAAALIVVAGFGAWSFSLYLEAERQKEQAKEARAEAVSQKEKAEQSQTLAEQRFNEKHQAMDDMLAQFSDKQLSGMPGIQEIRKVLFQRGVDLYEGILREKQNDRGLQLSLVARYAELGRLESQIGKLEEAMGPLKKAEKMLRDLARLHPADLEYRCQLGVTLYHIAYCFWEHGKYDLAVPALRESIAILARLAEIEPGNFEYAWRVAQSRVRLASTLNEGTKEREQMTRAAYDSLKRLIAERPKHAGALTDFARAAFLLGTTATNSKNYTEAETLFLEACRFGQRSVEIDPTDTVSYRNIRVSTLSLSDVYAATKRVDKAIEVTSQVVEDLSKLAGANPAVTYHQQALIWAHDALRKLYQLKGDYEKATSSLQEIVRIADAVAQHDPQNPRHAIDSIEASQNIADSLRTRKREAEAALILDKVIKQADDLMRLHPTSESLLSDLLVAHQVRGELSINVQQYAKAAEVYQRGVDLFTKYRSSIATLGEFTQYKYLQCCQGLVQIAREKKETSAAIAIAKKFIVPLKVETFTDGDYKQALIGELMNLSDLYADAGNVDQAIELRVRGAAEAKKILGGDPQSNYYLNQYVWGNHRHLIPLYRKKGDQRREFEELRSFLREEEPYVTEHDHSPLLAQTAAFTPRNLTRLRETVTPLLNHKGGLKRFTVPVDFSGIKYPLYIYVADSWRFLDDQFTWVEKVRGGKVPKEVSDSFRKLYKIAKDNKVSFVDLCVYALGTTTKGQNDDKANPIVQSSETANKQVNVDDPLVQARELAKAKEDLQAGRSGPLGRKRLALKYARLAEDELAGSNYYRAQQLLSEAQSFLDLDSFGRLKKRQDTDVFVYTEYVRGALLACGGELEKGYSTVMGCIRIDPAVTIEREFSVPAGNREFALGWICLQLKRPPESAMWYRKAMELGHRSAASRLYSLYADHPDDTWVLPKELRDKLNEAKTLATKTEPGNAVFARLVATPTDESGELAHYKMLASEYRRLATDYLKQSKREEALKAYNEEVTSREKIVDLLDGDQQADNNYIQALLDAARLSIDMDQAAEAVSLLEIATQQDSEAATFMLADLYAQGKGVPKDSEKASSIRARFFLNKGDTLYDDEKYVDALAQFERSAQWQASVEGLQKIGACQRKLGRNAETIATFKKAIALAKDFNDARSVVLDLTDAALSANKPDEVFAVLRLIEDKKWTKESTEIPYTMERELAGARAIALSMAGKEAAEAEQKLLEIASRPNRCSVRDRDIELDAWIKAAKPSEARLAHVRGILDSLDSEPHVLDSPLYPLAKDRAWVYRGSDGEQIKIRVSDREKVGEYEYWQLETVRKDQVISSQYILVDRDGVYRRNSSSLAVPHLRILPLPARGAESWTIKSAVKFQGRRRAETTGDGKTRVEDVKVPAGLYKGTVVAEVRIRNSKGKSVETTWYAKGVGPVKIKSDKLTLELEKVIVDE